MNSSILVPRIRRRARWGMVGCLLLVPTLLSGCAGQSGGAGADFGQVNMGPGDSRACYSNPCGVMFTLPPGTGAYTVRANNLVVGTYPAGQVANLGDFYKMDSPVTITIDGLDAKPAILYITGNW